MISFFVPGVPAAQGRPRTRVIQMGRRSVAQIYNPHNADEWKAAVAITARQVAPKPAWTKPVRIEMTFYLPRPKSHYRRRAGSAIRKADAPLWHASKPDGDNFSKALLDALTGILWADDSQVADQRTRKIYCDDAMPGCLVTSEQISDEPPAVHELCTTYNDSHVLSGIILNSQALQANATNA